ncbi:hypothetical protein, conserved [Eimeria praecox]|uniref:Uncharacterized protein n=1 Tax=Eimeria praecox TaxID=51316 RepID=U6GRS9_9EIME|nr:hypothetical protein, conserved [Eimeria praecox]
MPCVCLLSSGRRREAGVSESDAPLSSEGETQAQKMDLMLYSLISQIHECEKEKQRRPTPSFCVEAFISSPLTCSIQTASFATAASGKWFLCKSQRETVKRQTRVPWLLDPILKERTKTSAQVGTEATELQTKLQALRKKGSIASTVLDFSLLHPQHAWWLPSSPEQLLEILKGNAAKERTGSSSSSSGIYPFIVGKAEPWPPSIGAKSLKETSENMQSSLQNKSIPPPNSPLLKESAEALKLRTQVFIRILCAADNFFSGAVVSHPRFLKELLGVGKVKPGDVNGAVLTCAEGKEHLTVLGAQGSRTSYEGAERKSSSSSEISDAEA